MTPHYRYHKIQPSHSLLLVAPVRSQVFRPFFHTHGLVLDGLEATVLNYGQGIFEGLKAWCTDAVDRWFGVTRQRTKRTQEVMVVRRCKNWFLISGCFRYRKT